MKILKKRADPFLKKIALRAHRNIEARNRPTREVFQPTGGGGGWSPSGADLSPGGGYGQSPTGRDIAGTPFSEGGLATMFARRR
jgi:hypothetical protein